MTTITTKEGTRILYNEWPPASRPSSSLAEYFK